MKQWKEERLGEKGGRQGEGRWRDREEEGETERRNGRKEEEEGEKIPVQVPAIKTWIMSIDEIVRIFSKSQSLYRGGEFGKAFIGT